MDYSFYIILGSLLGVIPTFAMAYKKKTDLDNLDKIFKDLGGSVEIITGYTAFLSKPKIRTVEKNKIVKIQQAGIVSLFFESKAAIDIFNTANPAEVTRVAAKLFPNAEIVVVN